MKISEVFRLLTLDSSYLCCFFRVSVERLDHLDLPDSLDPL